MADRRKAGEKVCLLVAWAKLTFILERHFLVAVVRCVDEIVVFFWLQVSSFQHTGVRLLKVYKLIQVIYDGPI